MFSRGTRHQSVSLYCYMHRKICFPCLASLRQQGSRSHCQVRMVVPSMGWLSGHCPSESQLAEKRYTQTIRDMQEAWPGDCWSQGAPAGLKRQRNAIRRILLRAPAANSGTAREAAKGKRGKSEFVLASKGRRGLCCAGLRAQMHESETLN